ncbi:amidohydrolase family protein [Croceitalea sp. MTPC9]|uniref:metal-dependent hydrolase family protein n=1 Tax=unclassified Croceitalea TaxID=2632280 RepID=UPI002B3C726B|nr:amidohydrolase family protein [Croceitalea sp. MTPC6]GMN15287.1 amidohydrolase family protein [Croceitalea sp. MTPC9]
MRRFILVFFIFYNAISFSQNADSREKFGQKVIWAGSMLDVADGRIIKDVLVVIENDKIIKIDRASQKNLYKDTEIIDLSEYTILPGLIDCHAHLVLNSYDKSIDQWELPVANYGIMGTINARKTLEAGFTTVRDIWGIFYSDIALRDAINKGIIPGPRMYVSGPAITMTGGHGDWESWMGPHIELKKNPAAIADGVNEVQKEVRRHVKYGVDLIKITATGGFGTSGSIPGAASYTMEEIKAAVNEARKNGLKVAAHAHGAEGIKNAIKAGVASIEHGSLMDDESIELMEKHNVYLVMDLMAAHYDLLEKKNDYSDKKIDENNNEMYSSFASNFLKAHEQGVKMAFGTDAGVYPHGRNAEQFKLMVKAGISEMDAIKSATIIAAELIGIKDKTGSIEEGKWADIIAVKGNPLKDITILEKVEFVMKEGKVYKSN